MTQQLWTQRKYVFEWLGFEYNPAIKPHALGWEAISTSSEELLLSSLCVGRAILNTPDDERLRRVMLGEAVTWPIDTVLLAAAIGEANKERMIYNDDDDDEVNADVDRSDPTTWESTRVRLVELRALYEDSMAEGQSHVKAVASLFQFLSCNSHLDSILIPAPYNLLVFPKTHLVRAPPTDAVLRLARMQAVTEATGEGGAPDLTFGVLIDDEDAADMTIYENATPTTTCGAALEEHCGGDGGVFVGAAQAWAAETVTAYPHLTFLPDTVTALCANLAAEGTSATPLTLAVTVIALAIVSYDLTDFYPRVRLADNSYFLLYYPCT